MDIFKKSKFYTRKAFIEKWGKQVWPRVPSRMITQPFAGGVMFGAKEEKYGTSVSFRLTPDMAELIAKMLRSAAKEARKQDV